VRKDFAAKLFFFVAADAYCRLFCGLFGKSQIPLRYLVRSWFEAGSKMVADRFETGLNLVATSFEPDSVMEFGLKYLLVSELNNNHIIRRVFFD